jgi:hypothetical protein
MGKIRLSDKMIKTTVLTEVGFPGDPPSVPPRQYFGLSTFTTYTYSSGHLHILGPELADKLDFETGLILMPVTLT